MTTRTMAVVISALFCAGFASEALAQPCIPDPTNPNGMRSDCDKPNSDCPACGAANRQANYLTEVEAAIYLEHLDTDVDGASGEYMEIIHLGRPRRLDMDLEGTNALHTSCHLFAYRITEDADDPDVTKPAILLNAGVHPQEWTAQETAVGLVDLARSRG